jgi:hypothetical protein
MKCTTIERWILLERTGELSAGRRQRLAAHVAACAHCRAWREAAAAIEDAAREALTHGEPSQRVLVNIRREARVRAAAPHHAIRLTPWLRPAYGLATVAALCLVLVGGWWLRPDPNGFGGEEQLSTILLMLTRETDDTLAEAAADLPADAEQTASLDTLAQELLVLQGLDADYTETELSTPGEAPQATDPLTRSNRVSPTERYG